MAAPLAAVVWGDYNIPGVPSSGNKWPKKAEARSWGAYLESFITAIGTSGGSIYLTRASLFADLAHAASDAAWVIQDPTVAFNGIYRKNGNTGTGSWTRVADLPYSFIEASNTGGTANAIQATTAIPVSESALVLLNIVATNTASPVTVAFNGGSVLTIKSNTGNDIAIGGLTADMLVMGRLAGSTFRLVSDQVSSAIVAAAEAAQTAAEAAALEASDYADLALNNFVKNTFVGDGEEVDFPLSIDPGSANNMFVAIGGILQDDDAYLLFDNAGTPTMRLAEPAPEGIKVVVRFGSKIDVGAPADGSINEDKLANDAVTADKISAADAAAILVKIGAAAANAAVTNVQMPTGSVVDSRFGSYAANADLDAVIPRDNTIPQVTEGTEIISVTITPKSSTNKLRCLFRGQFAKSVIGNGCVAIFASGTGISGTPADARGAEAETFDTVDYLRAVTCGCEFVPGTTSPVTVTVRAGPDSTGGHLRFNGNSAGRIFGGVSVASLFVEEIKA